MRCLIVCLLLSVALTNVHAAKCTCEKKGTHKCVGSTEKDILERLEDCQPRHFVCDECSATDIKADMFLYDSEERMDTMMIVNSTTALRLDRDMFHYVSHLHTLVLASNRIESLYDDIFIDMTKLTHLYLYDNNLAELPSYIFSRTTKLEMLFLHKNKLREVKAAHFEKLVNLFYLTLNSNRITALPTNIFRKLESLTQLDLSDNPIFYINLKEMLTPLLLLNNMPCDTLQENGKFVAVEELMSPKTTKNLPSKNTIDEISSANRMAVDKWYVQKVNDRLCVQMFDKHMFDEYRGGGTAAEQYGIGMLTLYAQQFHDVVGRLDQYVRAALNCGGSMFARIKSSSVSTTMQELRAIDDVLVRYTDSLDILRKDLVAKSI